MRGLRLGIEIETVGLNRSQLCDAIVAAIPGARHGVSHYDRTVIMADGRAWTVVRDGSLSMDASGEITSPILTWEDLSLLQNIIRAVRAAGARVDSSCGIHVHVDGQQLTPKALRSLALLIYNREACIEAAVALAPARKARYCRPMEPGFVQRLGRSCSSMRTVNQAWYGTFRAVADRYDYSRYHGLNLNSFFYRGTVEFRYFNGSLHAGEVKAYVHLCLALAARAINSGSVGKKRETATYTDVMWTLTNQLALVGDEFKNTREHLTKRLPGRGGASAARRAERTPDVAAAVVAAPPAAVVPISWGTLPEERLPRTFEREVD